MKIVVIGGTGLIGSNLVTKLQAHGHEAVPASPDTGRQHAHRRGSHCGAYTVPMLSWTCRTRRRSRTRP